MSPTGPESGTPPDSSAHAAYLWQGFGHEWLRSVLGFRLPHRISKLDSYIDAESHTGLGAEWRSSATFHFGQATGVDGNYMKPAGYYAAVSSPHLRVHRGTVSLSWTDEIKGDPYPIASSRQEQWVDIDVSTLGGDTASCGVVLRGIELQTSCDEAKQPAGLPCNSNGMWPSLFRVAVGPCSRSGSRLGFRAAVEIARAWTPMKGGIPGIEEKPLNRRLDFHMKLHYTVLEGPADKVAIHRGPLVAAQGRARPNTAHMERVPVAGTEGGGYSVASAGISELMFELSPPTDRGRHRHRGRYIGALLFRLTPGAYDASAGQLSVDHMQQLWVPKTVVDTDVRYGLRATLIQLAGKHAIAAPPSEVLGSLCCDSSDQAPFFSHWKGSGKSGRGPAQADDARVIETGG